MANLKKIVYLASQSDFDTLVNTGTLTKDGKTLTYNPEEHDYRVAVNLTHETWTFTLENGTTVTKEVTLWTSQA